MGPERGCRCTTRSGVRAPMVLVLVVVHSASTDRAKRYASAIRVMGRVCLGSALNRGRSSPIQKKLDHLLLPQRPMILVKVFA
ncbi:hypothetical protein GCM10027074_42350 [Streptomyces deserti]